ncbi:MAG: B12-binding domain-containing radical SAM protein [Acidobacteria bacterium]|nr:B12-binding domain-containing radical SAM protein [Acidobacteriota bacterium]
MRWPPVLVAPVFRPPSEATSLILQLTVGCSWNRCTYCAMYRSKEFHVRPVDELVEEIRGAVRALPGVRRVFLADGDALAAPVEVLERVLEEIRRELPDVQRVGLYGDSRSILRHGAEELSRLRELGLGIVYFGPETGDEATLRAVRKGATVQRQLEAARTVTSAGIKLSMMVLLGLAGLEGSERHARATGRFITEAKPTYAAALTVTPVPGTELFDAVQGGSFQLPDRWGMLRELVWMLEEMEGYRGPFHANHASNYLPLKLRLPRDRESALELMRHVLETRDETRLRPEWARGL